jgi:hypothetical protein
LCRPGSTGETFGKFRKQPTTGALLINLSLVIGEFARTGWLPYPPSSETT